MSLRPMYRSALEKKGLRSHTRHARIPSQLAISACISSRMELWAAPAVLHCIVFGIFDFLIFPLGETKPRFG